jgi:hypothetical protein
MNAREQAEKDSQCNRDVPLMRLDAKIVSLLKDNLH